MALEITRIYKNAASDTLRVDTIYMEATSNALTTGVLPKTYYRRLSTTNLYEPADRVVASIELITTADNVDASGSFSFAEWTTLNAGQGVYCDMADLPSITDTV